MEKQTELNLVLDETTREKRFAAFGAGLTDLSKKYGVVLQTGAFDIAVANQPLPQLFHYRCDFAFRFLEPKCLGMLGAHDEEPARVDYLTEEETLAAFQNEWTALCKKYKIYPFYAPALRSTSADLTSTL